MKASFHIMKASFALVLAGCTHQPPATISPQVKPYVVRANVISLHDMAEAEALRIYQETGIYRGLDDQEWIDLMILIQESLQETPH